MPKQLLNTLLIPFQLNILGQDRRADHPVIPCLVECHRYVAAVLMQTSILGRRPSTSSSLQLNRDLLARQDSLRPECTEVLEVFVAGYIPLLADSHTLP